MDCDLSSAGAPQASGKGRDMMERPALDLSATMGTAAPFASIWQSKRKRKPGEETFYPLKARE